LAWPQVQVLVLPLGMVVAGGGVGVVVDTGEGVVVEAVTSDVTVTSPVTTAKNPLLVVQLLEVNLRVMVVPMTGPGMEVPENVWVEDP